MSVEPGREYALKLYGLSVSYGYHEGQPTMFVRRQPTKSKHGFVYGITLDNAHFYRHDDASAWDSALTATELLGLDPKMTEVVAYVGSVIEDRLEELLHLPPMPPMPFAKVLEEAVEKYGLTAKVNGETVLGA